MNIWGTGRLYSVDLGCLQEAQSGAEHSDIVGKTVCDELRSREGLVFAVSTKLVFRKL
jgi:hypothetical protein